GRPARAQSRRVAAGVAPNLTTRKGPALSRCRSPASGSPKWKLTTSGFVSSTTSHMTELNAVRLLEGTGDREFAVIRRQAFPPARLASVVEHRRRMAEEIEIYGFLRAGADLRHLLAHLI